jgi:hypothetical protein
MSWIIAFNIENFPIKMPFIEIIPSNFNNKNYAALSQGDEKLSKNVTTHS